MPASALEIITLAQLKDELRIPQDETDQDTMLTRQIESAVTYVATRTALPLVDTNETVRGVPLGSDCPICLGVQRGALEVLEFKYWETTQNYGATPMGDVAVADLGRLELREGSYAWLYPPATDWPDALDGSHFRVKIKRGLDTVPPNLAQAAVLQARILYNGGAMQGEQEAVDRLLAPDMVRV